MQLRFQFVTEFFEKNLVDGKFKVGLSNKPSHARFWHFLHKLWHLFFFFSNEGMLSATAIVAESAQNCQTLPKSAQKQLALGTLKYHQNLRF
jgi:hypothetical protein